MRSAIFAVSKYIFLLHQGDALAVFGGYDGLLQFTIKVNFSFISEVQGV